MLLLLSRLTLTFRFGMSSTASYAFVVAGLVVSSGMYKSYCERRLTMQYIPWLVLANTNSSILLLHVRQVKQ